jgi:2-polyprenyl-3-methyl-5-hydroxy-6-metoxy-1,4-benzoquinol methylase
MHSHGPDLPPDESPVTGVEAEVGSYPYLEEINQSIVRTIKSLSLIDSGRRVLDVGCGFGALGKEFRRRGFEVWGIERDPKATALASERIDRVIVADLADRALLDAKLSGNQFDVIVFSDVLEHMLDPRGVVLTFLPYLAPAGRVIISVPNVANWQTRLGLLFGRFTYRDTGVLDRTHVRFFTRRSTIEFVRSCGLQVRSVDHTPMLVRAVLPVMKRRLLRRHSTADVDVHAISDSAFYRAYLRLVLPIERMIVQIAPGLLAFQTVVTATRPDRQPQ